MSTTPRAASTRPKQRGQGGGAALHGEIGLNDWLKFRTITAYRKDRSRDADRLRRAPAADVDVPAIYRNKQFSQEFQLVADKGPLQGVAGFYYLDANAFDVFDVRLYTAIRPSCPASLPRRAAMSRPRPGRPSATSPMT